MRAVTPRLAGRTALVTGASSGIGAVVAELLAREGARVALLARGDGLDAVARRVVATGGDPVVLRADVGRRDEVEHAVERAVGELGQLDVVVVGAAAGAFGRFEEIPPEDFDRCVAVTFGGAVDTIRAVLPHLERSHGRLVVIGSAADTVALSLLSPYVAAKHALDGFVRTLRAELAASHSNVTISVIRPGPVDSPFWKHLTHHGDLTPPRLPPLAAYSAASVARAVVACAIEPRRVVTVGGAMRIVEGLGAIAPGAMRRALTLVARLGRSQASVDRAPNALSVPSGDGTVGGGLGGRPSVVTAARLRGSRPAGADL